MFAMWQPLMIAALSTTRVRGVFYGRSHDVASGISCQQEEYPLPEEWEKNIIPYLAAPINFHPRLEATASYSSPDYADIAYKVFGKLPLLLDIYLPQKKSASGSPALINIHGGRWRAGGKSYDRRNYEIRLLEEGVAIVNIDYRLLSQDTACFGDAPVTWPAQGEDVEDAVRWLKKNGPSHGVDPDRLGCLGTSAGGHLCNWLGVAGASSSETGLNLVVTMFGFTCFLCSPYTDHLVGRDKDHGFIDDLFGFSEGTLSMLKEKESTIDKGQDTKLETALALVRSAEPLFKLKDADGARIPRFFIVQGQADPACEPDEARWFTQGLIDAGAAVNLTMVADGAHSFEHWQDGPIEQAIEFVKHNI